MNDIKLIHNGHVCLHEKKKQPEVYQQDCSRGETSMEKNRLRPMRIPGSKNIRMSYARQKDVLDMPNLIEVQKNSYQWF